jgi:lipopolysaccharide transport system permease protein
MTAPVSPYPQYPAIRIEPLRSWEPLRLKDIWEYRELLYFLAWRDLKVSYARTVLGVGWAVLKPLLSMVVFTVIFGWLTQLPSDGIPYPIFVYAGLLPWHLFARVATTAGSSMVANENLVTKVYFPRLIVPLSVTVTSTLDYMIGFAALLGMMGYYHIPISITTVVWMIPCLMVAILAAGLGIGLWIAALNVLWRDVGHVQPFLIQLWLFATPIVYPSSLVPEQWKWLYGLNPMAGVVEGFRSALFSSESQVGFMMMLGVAVTGILLVSGLYVFQRTEQMIADTV